MSAEFEINHPRKIEADGNPETSKGYGSFEIGGGVMIFWKWGPEKPLRHELLLADKLGNIINKQNNEIKIPEQIAFTVTESGIGIAEIEHVEPKHEPESVEKYSSQIVEILTTLHNVEPYLFAGNLKERDRDYYYNKITSLTLNLQNANMFTPRESEYVARIATDRLEAADWKSKTFVHGDFAPHNFIIKPAATAVFDFENSGLGNPMEDWGRLTIFYRVFHPEIYKNLMNECPNPEAVIGFQTIQALFLASHYSRKSELKRDTHSLMARDWWTKVSKGLSYQAEPFTEEERLGFIFSDEELLQNSVSKRERKNYLPQYIFQ